MGGLPDTIAGIRSSYVHEGLWWTDPMASSQMAFWHLYFDAQQNYGKARTGGIDPPGYRYGDPYWIGKWVDAGWAILLDNDSAFGAGPYRLFLTPEPWYVALLCTAGLTKPWYSIVDAPPEVARAASIQLGHRNPMGYGFEGKEQGQIIFPSLPQAPGVPTLPAIPDLPGGYAPQPEPVPASAVQSETTTAIERPSSEPTPRWMTAGAGALGGLAVLWYLRRTGRL